MGAPTCARRRRCAPSGATGALAQQARARDVRRGVPCWWGRKMQGMRRAGRLDGGQARGRAAPACARKAAQCALARGRVGGARQGARGCWVEVGGEAAALRTSAVRPPMHVGWATSALPSTRTARAAASCLVCAQGGQEGAGPGGAVCGPGGFAAQGQRRRRAAHRRLAHAAGAGGVGVGRRQGWCLDVVAAWVWWRLTGVSLMLQVRAREVCECVFGKGEGSLCRGGMVRPTGVSLPHAAGAAGGTGEGTASLARPSLVPPGALSPSRQPQAQQQWQQVKAAAAAAAAGAGRAAGCAGAVSKTRNSEALASPPGQQRQRRASAGSGAGGRPGVQLGSSPSQRLEIETGALISRRKRRHKPVARDAA